MTNYEFKGEWSLWFVGQMLCQSTIADDLVVYIHTHMNKIKEITSSENAENMMAPIPASWQLTKKDLVSILKRLDKLINIE